MNEMFLVNAGKCNTEIPKLNVYNYTWQTQNIVFPCISFYNFIFLYFIVLTINAVSL